MSHDPDGPLPVPPVPKPKTSTSTIYEAFKNLTGKNRKSGHILSPSGAIEPSYETATDDAPSAQADAPKTVESETRQEQRVGLDRPGFTGGPPVLRHVLGQLINDGNNTVKERIQAAKETTKLLAKYPIEDVEAIWSCAKDMTTQTESESSVIAGYGLLLACVKHKKLNARERIIFLQAVINDIRVDTLSRRIQVVNALTTDGKYLDHLESGVADLLVLLFNSSFVPGRSTRAKFDPKLLPDESCLHDTFEYTLAILKHNSRVLSEADLERLLERVVYICRETYTRKDLKKGIAVVDAVLTYALLPDSQLQHLLEILCSTVKNVELLSSFARATIHKILNSHLSPAATDVLLNLVRDKLLVRSDYPARGAVLILQGIMKDEEAPGHADFSVHKFLSALADSVKLSTVLYSTSFLSELFQVLLDILDKEEHMGVLSDPAACADFASILGKCRTKRESIRRQLQSTSSETAELHQIDATAAQIVHHLLQHYENSDLDEQPLIMDAIMQPPLDQLDDEITTSIISHQVDDQLLQPPTDGWFSNCERLRAALFVDRYRSRAVRLQSLKALSDAYNTADALNMTEAGKLVLALASDLVSETDPVVAEALCDLLVNVWTWSNDESILEPVLQHILVVLPPFSSSKSSSSRPTSQNEPVFANPTNGEVMQRVVAAMVRMFLRNLQRSSWKSQRIYTVLLEVAENASVLPAARITAFKLLVRLRTDVNYSVFIIPDPGCETLAAALCRTKNTYKEEHNPNLDSPISRPVRPDEPLPKRKNQSTPAVATSSRGNHLSRTVSRLSRVPAPTPPAWMYGKFKGLPEDPPHDASHYLSSHLEKPADDVEVEQANHADSKLLKINTWLELAIALLQQKDLDWEIYSYLICHIGAQLTNHSLFINSVPQLRLLRNILCSQLLNKTFVEPPASTNLKKGDVAVCLYDVLTMLISYRTHFAKGELEEMVKVFVTGIGNWERTSEFCIHALFICCLELPTPTTKSLDTALQKMTQIVTQAPVAAHVLEFLAGLARLPALFNHFSDVEYRKVFAICFRYLQYVRDQRRKSAPPGVLRSSNKSPGPNARINRDSGVQLDTSLLERSLADELPQYVYALAFHVMTFFFMSLKLSSRPLYLDWIAQNLTYKTEDGKEVVEEQAQVTLDYMRRIAFSDRDETAYEPGFAKVADGIVSKKSWVWGLEIVTIETAGRTGLSQLTRRRPSGTKYTIVHPQLVPPPRHQAPITYGSAADAFYSPDYVGVTPDDILQEMYSQFPAVPTLLPDDDMTHRSISTIDRIPALDGHKVGITYIGEGQQDEATILANVMGSEDYTAFLNGIGTLTRLKGAKTNCQGLDREFDTDGKFTYCWRNRVTELVFHVPTLMPTDLDMDPQCSGKKRHTGNDFVNIIFNNSGLPFDFDTFPSAFNFVNVVIVPEARTSFVDTRQRAAALRRRKLRQSTAEPSSYFSDNPNETFEPLTSTTSPAHDDPIYTDLFYKVTVHVKEGLPPISPAAETKMISGGCLPEFVRLLALNASVFAQVWANKETGEHVSSWRSRLQEITRLRERHAGPTPPPMPTIFDRELTSTTTSPLSGSLTLSPLVAPAFSGQHSLVATPGGSLSPLHQMQSPITPAVAHSTSTTVTAASSTRDNTMGGAAGLLRRMSQAAFFNDTGVTSSEIGIAHRSSRAGSGSEGRDRENSVGSRATSD